MTQQSIQEARQRAFRYYYDDGLVELAIGLFFTVMAAALWSYQRLLAGTPYGWLLAVILLTLTIGGMYAIKALISRMKETITYPRTGRVTYKERGDSRGRWLVIAAALAITVALIWLPGWLNQVPVSTGALLSVVLLYMGATVRVARMQAAAMLPVAAGVLAAYFGLGDIIGSVLVFGSVGLEMVLMGGLVLNRYMHNNTLAKGDTQHD